MDANYYMSTAVGILQLSIQRKHELSRARLAYAEALKADLRSKDIDFDELCLDIDHLENLCGVRNKMTNVKNAWPYVHSVQEIRNAIESRDTILALCKLVSMLIHENHDIAYCNALLSELIETYADNMDCISWRDLLKRHLV